MNSIKPNRLVDETSPYLKQHAYNPVNWYPWGEEALEKAKTEDKPIIISIGYAACHWCHVMERESFENERIAEQMNEHFICIKVDREERPDIDQIYMEAVHTMGLNGGWPLNVFATPDQKPFYGGTYFPPNNWLQILKGVAQAYANNRSQIEESAEEFSKVIALDESEKYQLSKEQPITSMDDVFLVTNKLKGHFDTVNGGMNRAPKFPMPSIWNFLLNVYVLDRDTTLQDQIQLTLDSMAKGGIYDQVAGGFARYSVDEAWFAPHFEKMLYDNGQLLTLYAEAYRVFQQDHYKEVIEQTVNWLREEMTDENGGFYAALDADSEGEEGKYYTWTFEELRLIIKDHFALFCEYYGIKEEGNWENDRNILHLSGLPKAFADRNNVSLDQFMQIRNQWINQLQQARSSKVRPGLDNKILAGWNGLMLKGLTDAYRVLGNEDILRLAVDNANYIDGNLIQDGRLYRLRNKSKTIDGNLEDYAFVISGFTGLYEATFDEQWILRANQLMRTAIEAFFDEDDGLFSFTSRFGAYSIARKKELFDNVIPASNSQMAINLHVLSKFFYDDEYQQLAKNMLGRMQDLIKQEPDFLTNWARLFFLMSFPTAEIVISGDNEHQHRKALESYSIPNKVLAAAPGEIPIAKERPTINEAATIYVCYDKTCKLPAHSVEEAVKQLSIESSVT